LGISWRSDFCTLTRTPSDDLEGNEGVANIGDPAGRPPVVTTSSRGELRHQRLVLLGALLLRRISMNKTGR